jgi:hypothetical protein
MALARYIAPIASFPVLFGALFVTAICPSPVCSQSVAAAHEHLQRLRSAYANVPSKWAIHAVAESSAQFSTRSFIDRTILEQDYYRNGEQIDVEFSLRRAGSTQPTSKAAPDAKTQRRAMVADIPISYESGKGLPKYVFVGEATEMRKFTIAQLQGGEALEGYLAKDPTFVGDILAAAPDLKVAVANDLIDGTQCVLLEGNNDTFGKYKVWIDAEGRVRQAEVMKGPRHQFSSRPISDHPPYSEMGRMDEYHYAIRGIKYKQFAAHHLPVECQIEIVQRFGSGATVTYRMRYARTKIETNPNFVTAGAFRPELPDGVEVTVMDKPGIAYVWSGGRLRPTYDANVIARIDQQISPETMGVSPAPRQQERTSLTWIAIGVSCIVGGAIGCLVILYRGRSNAA